MKNYNLNSKLNNFKYNSIYYIKKNKVKIFILLFIFVLSFLTGIFTIAKHLEFGSLSKDFLLADYLKNDFGSFADLFNRWLSCLFILVVLILSSFSVFLLPVSLLVWIYRSYLIGYNCTILVLCYGLNGILTSLIVILPCQLLLSFVFLLFFTICITKLNERKKKCCSCNQYSLLKLLLIFILLSMIICLIEFLLLLLFNVKVIFII